MCSGLIHHVFPADKELVGIIARLDTGHVFYMSNELDQLEENLRSLGADGFVKFIGKKDELIATIRRLNREHGLPGFNPLTKLKEKAA